MPHWNQAAALGFGLNLAVKSTVLIAVAWLAALLLRRRSAAARHIVWMAAFSAVLALPLLALAVPALNFPLAWIPDASALVFTATAAAAPGLTSVLPVASSPSIGHLLARGFALHWPLWLTVLWLAGSLALLAQTAVVYLRLAAQRRRAPAFDVASDLPPGVAVLESAAGSMPMTFGVFHPVVFLPADARGWSDARRTLVLRHELAHIHRADAAMHLAARSALSLVWWNPLAWMAWREFLKEREKATDDMVLCCGARASDYAGHLLEIARSMQTRPATAWAAVAMARRSQLEGRLLSILDGGVSRKSAKRGSAIAACAVAIALCAPFAGVRAQSPQALSADVEATIRAATSQNNHEIVDIAATAFENIRNFDTARKLLEAGLAIRASEAGEQSALYAAGLVKLGDLETRRNNSSEAVRFYQKAVEAGDRPETAPALLQLGIRALEGRDYAGAMNFLQRAAASANSPQISGQAYMWMGVAEETRHGHEPQAEENLRKAIAALPPNSSEAATAMNLLGRFLTKQNRPAEAQPFDQQASSIVHDLEKTGRARNAQLESAKVYAVNADITRPELLRKVEPQYTEEARAARFEGVVVLSVVIEPDGTADKIQVMKSLGLGLDEKAIEAVQQWRFKPGTKDGAPVAVSANIEVNFRLL